MKPGMHDLTFEQYWRLDAVNNSLLQKVAKSPAHARHYTLHPPDSTPAQLLGQATHSAILQPDDFADTYVKMPTFEGHANSNAYKAAKAEWQLAHGAHVHLSASEYDLCCALRDSAWANPDVASLLHSKGRNEVTITWIDPSTGLECKARLDRFTMADKWSVVLDLKTCRSAAPFSFSQAVAQYGYHRQAALYLRGLEVLSPHPRRFLFIAIEKEPPYCCAVYELERDALMAGEEQVQALLHKYRECLDSNVWPGYPPGIQPLRLPEWALNRRFDDE